MLKVWGRTNSVNVQKVMWRVGDLRPRAPAHRRRRRFGRVDTPEYTAINPNGRSSRPSTTTAPCCGNRTRSSAISRPARQRAGCGPPTRARARCRPLDGWQLTTLQWAVGRLPGLGPHRGQARHGADRRECGEEVINRADGRPPDHDVLRHADHGRRPGGLRPLALRQSRPRSGRDRPTSPPTRAAGGPSRRSGGGDAAPGVSLTPPGW